MPLIHNEQALLDYFDVDDLMDLTILLEKTNNFSREIFIEPESDDGAECICVRIGLTGSVLAYPFTVTQFRDEIRSHIRYMKAVQEPWEAQQHAETEAEVEAAAQAQRQAKRQARIAAREAARAAGSS